MNLALHFVQNGKVVLVHSFVASQGFCFLSLSVFKWLLLFCSEGYFPASGFRHNVSGDISNCGIEGSSWATSSYSVGMVHCSRLFFNWTALYPLHNNTNRDYGFPVRCVQGLASVLYRSIIKARSTVE